MKKTILLILLALIASFAQAQKNSIKFQVGYGMPLAGNSILQKNVQQSSNNSSSVVSGSLGSGLNLELGYTYSFAPLISAQVDFTYIAGKEYSARTAIGSSYVSNESYKSNFFQVAPLFRFDIDGEKVHPYAAIGPVFGFGSIINKFNEDNDGDLIDEESKYSGSIAIGSKAVLGLEFTKGKLSYFVQATMINMSYAPAKSELTKSVLDGTNDLPNLQTYYKQTDYKKSISFSNQTDFNKPKQQLREYFPYGSISLNVGVRYKF